MGGEQKQVGRELKELRLHLPPSWGCVKYVIYDFVSKIMVFNDE